MIKLLEQNIHVNLHDHGLGNGFFDMACKAQQDKTIDELKLKTSVLQRTSPRSEKTIHSMGDNICK